MQLYQNMYLHLFNAVTDALQALEDDRPERAKVLLIEAQQQAEAYYMECGNPSAPGETTL